MKQDIDKKKILLISIIIFLLLGIITLLLYRSMLDISSPYPEPESSQIQETAPTDTISFGVISRFPSNVLYRGYQPLMDYLTNNTDYYFELVISRSYKETVQQVANSEVSSAFLGSYIYVMSRDEFGLKPILKPLNDQGEPYFHSALIVPDDSDIESIACLRNKRLALPSEESFSGNWLPMIGLREHNMTIEDLKTIEYFQHHHTVVYEIMRDNFDAGAVKDRVAREFSNRGVKTVVRSNAIPGSPIVVSEDYDEEVISAIKEALLRIDPDDPAFRDKVRNWDPEFAYGFTEASSEDYDFMLNHLYSTLPDDSLY